MSYVLMSFLNLGYKRKTEKFSNFLQHLTLHLWWNCGHRCEISYVPEIHSNWNQQCSAYGVVDITICWCCFDIQSSCFGLCVIVLHGSSNMYGGKCYHHHFDPLIPINLFPALLWLDTIYTMGWNNFCCCNLFNF